jgi:D-alanyl-D-alanine dipeptidase
MTSSPFGALEALRQQPIPAIASARGYRATPIAFDAAANYEALKEVREHGISGENYYGSQRNPPYYLVVPGAIQALVVRQGVLERLQGINARLASVGLELFLYDGWRPQAVQRYFHDVWMPAAVRRRNPGFTDAQVWAEVETYWAAPTIDENGPSPHSTGGAVDLSLRWKDGAPLWMGSLFDDVSALAHPRRFEDGDCVSFSDEEARANRRLLHWLMIEAGFAPNPTEWWHFSFGDQMWAKLTNAEAALYGGAEYSG